MCCSMWKTWIVRYASSCKVYLRIVQLNCFSSISLLFLLYDICILVRGITIWLKHIQYMQRFLIFDTDDSRINFAVYACNVAEIRFLQ